MGGTVGVVMPEPLVGGIDGVDMPKGLPPGMKETEGVMGGSEPLERAKQGHARVLAGSTCLFTCMNALCALEHAA